VDGSEVPLSDLAHEIGALIGLPFWSFVGGNGSRVALDFGAQILREHALTNDKLTEEQRLYEAERHLFVECPWSLFRRGLEICTWEDEYESVDAAFAGSIGRLVQNARIELPTGRLEVTFDNGDRFEVRSDQSEEWLDGYSLFTPTEILTVDAAGAVLRKSRAD
jgi:hypothetical protein